MLKHKAVLWMSSIARINENTKLLSMDINADRSIFYKWYVIQMELELQALVPQRLSNEKHTTPAAHTQKRLHNTMRKNRVCYGPVTRNKNIKIELESQLKTCGPQTCKKRQQLKNRIHEQKQLEAGNK